MCHNLRIIVLGLYLPKFFPLLYYSIGTLQQAMEERYKLCDDGLARLLVWISNVEAQLANLDTVREDIAELKNQINVIRVNH